MKHLAILSALLLSASAFAAEVAEVETKQQSGMPASQQFADDIDNDLIVMDDDFADEETEEEETVNN